MLSIILPESKAARELALKHTETIIDSTASLARYTDAKMLIIKIDHCVGQALKKFVKVPDDLHVALRVILAKLYNKAMKCSHCFELRFDIKRDDTGGFEIVPCNIQTLIFLHGEVPVPKRCANDRYEKDGYIYRFSGTGFQILEK